MPAEIISIMESSKIYKRPEHSVFQSAPEDYEEYQEHKKARVVQWSMKKWKDFTQDDLSKLAVHMVGLGEAKAHEYSLFLKDKVGAPGDLLGYLGVYFNQKVPHETTEAA